MNQVQILFVDEEQDYLILLVMKFIEALGDKVEINMITDINYLDQYLEQPHDINYLIIDAKLYDKRFERFCINDIYYLIGQENRGEYTEQSPNVIYKYSSIGNIYTKIASLSGLDKISEEHRGNGKLIMTYSPIGGSGKTYASLGIARALAALNKKVFYLNVESVQNFDYYIQDSGYLSKEFEQALLRRSESILDLLRGTIRKAEFDYLPPFEQSVIALNISLISYQYLIQKIKEIGVYDFIILETPSEFTQDNVTYMGMSDKVLIITNQDRFSAYKLNRFLYNIDYKQPDKFKIICNAYMDDIENELINQGQQMEYDILEYIRKEEEPQDLNKTVDKIIEGGFQKIAYYLI